MAASEDLFADLERVGAQTERADPEVIGEKRQDPEVLAKKPDDLFADLERAGGGKSAYQEPESTETKSGDAWTAAKVGVQRDVVQPLTAGLGYLARGAGAENVETILRNLGVSSKETEEENLADLSPAARKSVQASIFDPEFTSNIARGIGYKGVNMIPGIIAQIAPALLFSNPITATGAVAATGAAFGGGSYIQQINDSVDKATPEMLASVPFYKKALDAGASEDEAKARLKDEVLGHGPLINAIVGAAVNAAGPMGALARTARGGAGSLLAAGRTLPGRLAAGAGEGAALNSVQAGVEEATRQTALVDNGLQDGYDLIQGAKAVGEAGVIGGVMGAGAGTLSHGAPSAARPEIGRGLPENVRPENRPDVAQPAPAETAAPAQQPGVEIVGEKDTSSAEAAALIASNPPSVAKANPAARDVAPHEIVPASEKVDPHTDIDQPVRPEDLAAAPRETPAQVREPVAPVKKEAATEPTDLFADLERTNDRGGRILVAKDAEAEHNLAAQRAEQEANLASLNEKPPGERETRTAEDYSPKDAKRRDERDRQATVAETIFDAVPDRVYPKTEADRQALRTELGKVLDIAKSEKIDVARIKGNETQSDHLIWLRDAYDLKKILDKKNVTQKAREERDSRLLSFLSDEKVAKETGDFSSMRERRRVEGEEKMGRKGKGSAIDQVADTKEADTGKAIDEKTIEAQNTEPEVGGDVTLRGNESKVGTEDVETVVAGSAASKKGDGDVRGINAPGFGEGGIYGKGKKVEITDAERAKYNTPGVKAAKERIAAAAAKTRTTKGELDTKNTSPAASAERGPRASLSEKAKAQRLEATKAVREARAAAKQLAADKAKPAKETVVESAKRSAEEEAELSRLMSEQAAEIARPANGDERNAMGEVVQGPKHKDTITIGDSTMNREHYMQAYILHYTGFGSIVPHPLRHENGRALPPKVDLAAVKAALDGIREGKYGMPNFDDVSFWNDKEKADAKIILYNALYGKNKVGGREATVLPFGKPQVDAIDAMLKDAKGKDGPFTLLPPPKLSTEQVHATLRKLAEIARENEPKPDGPVGGPSHFSTHTDTGEPVLITTLHTAYAKDILTKAKWDELPKGSIAAKLFPFLAKHIQQFIGDVKIHFVTSEQMAAIKYGHEGIPLGKKPPLGLAMSSDDPGRRYIAINLDDHENTTKIVHTIMHEAVHIATVRGINESAHLHRAITYIAKEFHNQWTTEEGGKIKWGPGSEVYAFTNAKEFIAEAFSNPKFQKQLAETTISEYTARLAGLDVARKPTLWDWFIGSIAKYLRIGDADKVGYSALQAILRIGEDTMRFQRTSDHLSHLAEYVANQNYDSPFYTPPTFGMGPRAGMPRGVGKRWFDEHASRDARIADPTEHAREIVNNFATNSGSKLRQLKNSLSTFVMLGQRAEHVLPGSDAVVKAMQQMETERHRILTEEGGLAITQKIADHEREHGVASRQKVTSLGFDASEANVNLGAGANNSHLGIDATKGWQAKARLKDLQARYDGLLPPEKKLFDEMGAYYRKVQNDLSLQLIKNTLSDLQLNEPGLAERIHREGLTDADKEKLKTNTAVNALNEMRELKKIEGYYLPFARYGDWVVNSYSKLERPKGTVVVDGQPDTVRFVGQGGSNTDARNRARVFVENHNLKHIDTKQVWVDKFHPEKTLEPEDVNAVQAYDVTMQRQSTQFFENEAEARRVQTEMAADWKALGLEKEPDGVVRKYDFMAKNPDGLSGHMATVWSALEKQAKYQRMSSDERAAVRQTLNEATLRLRGPTRLQSQFLQRRNVAGYSTDAGRVTANYARASAGYLARLREQPALDAAFDNLKKYIADHKFESNDRTIKRSEFYNEMLKRTYQQEPVDQGTLGRVSKRLLQISRLDKLAGVSFHVINAQEPWTTSLPVIGGRHGMIRAGRALANAYNMIGGRGALGAGFRDTMKAYRTDGGFTDYLQMFKDNINSSPAMGDAKKSRFGDLIDYLDHRGIVSDSAVFEVDRYSNPSSNVVGRALDRADLMANQVGTAVEKINRVVTAIAAYDLEFNRTGNHEGAMHYEYEVTHDTMGDYATWNSPSAFKTPIGALALQFKKFALKSYYLLGKTMQGAINGDREAAKQFIGLMATHAVVAGALGLPGLEPFKVALMASNVMGITGFTWDDFELAVRSKSAELFGMKGGEVFSKGAYRLAGVEVSNRLGWDNLGTQPGGIRDASKTDDVWAYLAKTMFGASASWMMDQAKMAQALQKGDFAKAAELVTPIKAGSDVIKALSGQSPRLDNKGREVGQAYTPYETAIRALGFQPSNEAENFAKRAAIAGQTKKQTQARTTMIDGWVNAKGGGKDAQLKAIQQWNKDNPTNQAIGMKDLLRAQQTRKDNPTGMKKTDRNANVYDKLAPIFGN